MNRYDGKTVLVVNDDPTQLRLLAAILEKDGLRVLSCESAEAGLALMRAEGAPDALVTDLHMPGIDGWRFCRLLRSPEYAALNELPILVVSATFAGDHAREVTRDLGANAFLSLPCQASELRRCVQALLAGINPRVHPTVLIVEDSPTLALLLERTFREHGYLAASALNGYEGRRRFQELSPELVILDYHLPDISGDQLLCDFNQGAGRPAVIIITADANLTLANRFLTLGANAYLRKPFDPRYLVELGDKVRRERALLRVEDILETRTRELRESHAKLQESEAKLRESEENYRLLVANLPAVVFTGYADCSMDFYDDKIEALTAYTREEFSSRRLKWGEVILPEDRPGARQVLIQALKGDKHYVREYRIRTRSGNILWIQERSQIILRADGEIAFVRGLLFDVSERKRLEEERLKLDKLESLGVLAGGIAHDFNNLLTAMLGNVNLAKLAPGLPKSLEECLSGAEQACLRAQALSQQLLTFAQGGAPLKKIASLFPLIQEAVNLALAGSRCGAQLSLSEELWPVEVDSGQLSQALHNILINADQAMPNGGVIMVAAENVMLADQKELPLLPGPYVKIAISDQGTGIDSKYLGKIFDPYFTTKVKGSGLGLATAFSIVKKHGGHLTVESTPGEGATFTLYLPAAQKPPAPESEPVAEPATGQGKILVMDDEPLVLEVAGRMLNHLGYEVEEAPDGAAALEKYRRAQTEGRPFDAVILDLTVPGGLGGQETLEKLRGLDPQIKALVSSGYADNLVMTRFADHGFQGVIKKPYRLTDFSQVLNRVLKSQPEAVSHEPGS
jgi:PAS domain S-box-containing protein